MKRTSFRMTWAHWVSLFGAWTLLSVFFAPELYLFFVYRKENIGWGHALILSLANTAIAAVLVPAVVWLAVRFPLGRSTWKKALAVHAPACLVFSVVHSSLYAALCFASPAFHVLFSRFHPNLLTYWAVVGFVEAFRYFRAYSERERTLANMQLELMRAQLQPHFLFNTLHTVSSMMHEDVALADRMINRLSELLRMTVDRIGRHEAALSEEMDFVRGYFEIEQVRFGDHIRLEAAATPEALAALAPSMGLQPLVENSIRHGFRAHGLGGVIRIDAFASARRLVVRVTDDGAGPRAFARAGGMGIPNVRARLSQLYGEAHTFTLERVEPHGFLAQFEIPLRGAMPEDAGEPQYASSHR